MKKKVVAALLSVAMAATLLAGCGSGGGASTDSSNSGESASSGSEAQAEAAGDEADASGDEGQASAPSGETVKLKALAILHPLTQDVDDMEYVAEIEAEAGVEIEWELIRADW